MESIVRSKLKMNRKQLIVLWVTATLLVLVCIFPPTYYPDGFLGSSRIDTVALIVQCVVPIIVIGTGLFLTLGNKTERIEPSR